MNAHLTPVFQVNFPSRYRSGRLARWGFQFSTLLGIALLALLMFTILDGLMGYAAMTDKVSRESLAVDHVPLEALSSAQLLGIYRPTFPQMPTRRWIINKPWLNFPAPGSTPWSLIAWSNLAWMKPGR